MNHVPVSHYTASTTISPPKSYCQESAPVLPRPTYLHKDEEEAGGLPGLPGTKKTAKYREENTKLLETFTEKEEYDNTRCFCCFMPVIYFF